METMRPSHEAVRDSTPSVRRKTADFADFKDLSIFEEFLQICGNLLGLTFDLWNPIREGDRLFHFEAEHYTSFCKCIYASRIGRELCWKCDMTGVHRAMQTGEPQIYQCHAGLTEIALPLIIHGVVCAVLLTGQILSRAPGSGDRERIARMAHRLGLDCDTLYKAFLNVKLVPDDKTRDIVKWFTLFTSYVARLGHDMKLMQTKQDCDAIGRVKEIILNHFDDDSVSLQRIARDVHLSPSHLSRMFHRQTGTTLTDYRNLVRIEEAKKLLATTNLKICDICYDVGYQSLSNFTRTFIRHVGISPRTFRKQACAEVERPQDFLKLAQ